MRDLMGLITSHAINTPKKIALVDNGGAGEEEQARCQILAGMQNKSCILVNGSNRLIFEF